ncbi:ribonuclease HIII [Mesomycoplasma conjunctivae]|uniref:ribonuclease HIII n=1 Tax=Mesomycoplasma conjunctivae TaxID=45361 RepID=UPI003DA3597C
MLKTIKISKSDYIVGCDEVGVGEYFTNLTVCCALFKQEDLDTNLLNSIVDSKLLNEKKIEEIYRQLEEKIIFEVISLDMDKYNDLINMKFNSHEIKTILYLKLLKKLKSKYFKDIDVKKIYIDGFVTSEKFFSYLEKIYQQLKVRKWDLKKFPILLEKKADEKIKQAGAASIIAKHKLSLKFHKREKKWKTKFPAGSNQLEKIINFCIEKVKIYGDDFLYQNVKQHFSITKKIQEKLK